MGMHQSTRDYLLKRATESGLKWEQLAVDFEEDPVYEVSVIYGGSLDEDFYLGDTGYEVNIADWIAELCAREASTDSESWEILVTEYLEEDAGPVRYRVTDQTFDGAPAPSEGVVVTAAFPDAAALQEQAEREGWDD